jgi:hypothetical protein
MAGFYRRDRPPATLDFEMGNFSGKNQFGLPGAFVFNAGHIQAGLKSA